tara:strand:+ start:4427 stop:4858 length:432 start_codon:yes stop_codon:yes gene_type:complete
MQTKSYRSEQVEKSWWIVDAAGKNLGRMSTQIANILRGKHRPTYSPNADTGDFVVVVNADKIEMSGNKWDEKKYYTHSRYFGSTREKTAFEVRESNPEFIIQQAVEGMLPKNRLARRQIKHLKVYSGAEHPHKSQNPQALDVK